LTIPWESGSSPLWIGSRSQHQGLEVDFVRQSGRLLEGEEHMKMHNVRHVTRAKFKSRLS
jgi:hypothetical protein